MKFRIKKDIEIEKTVLSYRQDEYSFDMEPAINEAVFTILINYLNLTIGNNNKVVQIWGYCPYSSWIINSNDVPEHDQGELIVASQLKPGFSYSLNNDEEWAIYVNSNTGWICIGNPEKRGEAIEFLKNCVAVLEQEKLVSLWLKPTTLPKI